MGTQYWTSGLTEIAKDSFAQPDHRLHTLARSLVQLLESVFADDQVAEVASRESRRGPRGGQKTGEHTEASAVHDVLTTNAQVEDLDASYTRTAAMAIVPLTLSPHLEARALMHHLLEHGDIIGRDTSGRTVIQLTVDDWVLERLLTFDADAAELQGDADAEPDADDEEDGPPALVEFVRRKMVARHALASRYAG